MKNEKLDSDEIEDLEFSLSEFEKRYGIHITQDELSSIESIEQLTGAIANKFNYENVENCTNQQAFYKLRNILNNHEIKPNTKLEELISRKNRIQKLKEIEKELGFKLEFLQPKKVIRYALPVLTICVIILAFFNFFQALIFGTIVCALYEFVFKNGKEFKISTVGELVKIMVRENYFLARRNPESINKEEFKKVTLEWFADRLDIECDKLKTAKFV